MVKLQNIKNENYPVIKLDKNIYNLTINNNNNNVCLDYECHLIMLKKLNLAIKQKDDLITSCKNIDLKINIFNAIEGNKGYKIIKNFLKVFNLKKKTFHKKICNLEHIGRIGCLASHLTLWMSCIEKNKNILILENDVTIQEDFSNVIKIINKDIILFDPFNPYSEYYNANIELNETMQLKILDGHTKKQNTDGKLKGAYCYIITPNGAKKIINYIIDSDEWLPADYYFNEDILNIGTTNKTIFRINKQYKAGKISSTKNFNNVKKK